MKKIINFMSKGGISKYDIRETSDNKILNCVDF